MNIRPTFLNFHKTIQVSLSYKKYSINKIEKSVIISESNDIYTNLALEDWYHRNWSSKNKHMLILWSNNPCVVIGIININNFVYVMVIATLPQGKFQNPWLEANISELGRLVPRGVQLARRNSGGGTVYHDRGNLNLTFFTPREHYNRRHNLEIITRAVLKEYGLKIDITKRDDLVIGDCKVSGTAAKLARSVAYHHCTLLVNCDKTTLSVSLRKPEYEIKTNATQSTKSKIINLVDINKAITVENLMVCIGREYLSTVPEYANKQENAETNESAKEDNIITKFRILRPTEEEFPELTEIRDTLSSWEWRFGKCPKFTAIKSYPYLSEQRKNKNYELKVIFMIEDGKIKNAELELPEDVKNESASIEMEEYIGRKFAQELFEEVFYLVCERLKVSGTTKTTQ